ncbi:MAG: GntR family transcriptional regulator [Verrucomicrobia bacterium]|nr:GntR family transcriptional regulator [Verrucomicrobiota bacterium]
MKTASRAGRLGESLSLSSTLFSTIQERIVSGKIPPGLRLVERDLCEEFGVSRGIVRESIVRLSNSGLVETAPDVGAKVSAFTTAHIIDAFLFREGVESIAAEQCAVRMNREQAAALELLAQRFAAEYAAHSAGRPNQLHQLDVSFHRAIVEGSANALIRRAWDTAMLHFIRGVKTPPAELVNEARVAIVDDHLAIAAAIKAGSAAEAGLKMKRHLQHGRSLFVQYSQRNLPIDASSLLTPSPRRSKSKTSKPASA